MSSDNTSYERYRRAEAEITEQLEERRRAAEEAAKRARILQFARARGFHDEFESNLRDLHRYMVRSERMCGSSLREARGHADVVIARVWKDLMSSSPICRGDDPAQSDPQAGQ